MSSEQLVNSRLARLIQPLCDRHPELSGVYPLEEGNDAFAARYLLTNMAEKTLDVQYYIWRNDLSGRLLFSALFRAAERGVKVRLLLDDNNTGGLDESLRRLNAHPNISVKLFNPFQLRRMRCLCYLTDFKRLNRRMHNKSMTFDRQATIVGGRNVGDEYFGIGEQPLFSDLDVLAVGNVVADVCQDFERYWTSACVSPAED
ncbi:MAG: phospholipase D-like domain-containing protein, partial [Hafnia alvei]|nr:phospholipase D-like domain-containing protein [Hafnia alvei]